MEPVWLKVLLVMGACAFLAGLSSCTPLGRLLVRAGRLVVGHLPRRQRLVSPNRPIEDIASDVRRLGYRFHHPRRGLSFARFEGTRWAYDKALSDGCRALGIVHLLGVLEPGPDLDVERRRVELLLGAAGIELAQDA